MKTKIFAMGIFILILISSVPLISSKTITTEGFKGVSWKEVVPIKKVTFVGFDEESILDDYSFLASIPANVFYDEKSGKIISNPLLYYDPPRSESSLDSNEGIHYFMEDWITYCGGILDQIQVINVKDDQIQNRWDASSFLVIEESSPYETASKIALSNWEKSSIAVVSCIEESFEDVNKNFKGSITGEIPGNSVLKKIPITNSRGVGIDPQYNNFTVENQFKYVTANLTWRGGKALDPDLQLIDWEGGMVDASAWWSLTNDYDAVSSYIFHPGDWSATVTYMPTKTNKIYGDTFSDTSNTLGRKGRWIDYAVSLVSLGERLLPFEGKLLSSIKKPKDVTYDIDITLYPGEEFQLPETPYGCRNAIFEIESQGDLGLLLKDATGATFPLVEGKRVVYDELGEGNYSIVVLKLDDSSSTIPFELKYSWEQKFNETEGYALHSAAEGAVLASINNAPLLFSAQSKLPSATKDALDKLGVDKIFLVDLDKNHENKITESLKEFGTVTEYYDFKQVYSKIQSYTKQNDLVISTINPWSYWKAGTLQPEGEKRYAYYIGPATLAAAHHGVPILITDVHPPLSRANAWHNNEWKHMAPFRYYPPVAPMALTGWEVYDFINEIGFDGLGQESMLTVAGQFDIGTTWDRVFVGWAYPGRIMGTPVDTAYWICRSVFYPALIFSNPAVDTNGVTRITGSESERRAGRLIITNPERDVRVIYPILESHVVYEHRFNEVTSKRWGIDYISASGIIPFHDPSPDGVDMDVNSPYEPGQFYPDMTSSEILTFYAQKLGYDSVFTTNFPTTIKNLNDGVLMWIEVMHGLQLDSGSVAFWKDQKHESNPWRGYEQGGSTENPDTLTFMKNIGVDILPSSVAGNDGIVIAYVGQLQTEAVHGEEIDEALENVHSAGFLAGSCLISNTLLHLALVRHGFVYQVIDPWVTSWYATFGFEMFLREWIKGATLGEAYWELIRHVGIQYLDENGWWDTSENIEYFGDPDLVPFTPFKAWKKPPVLSLEGDIDGHTLLEATKHPGKTPGFEAAIILISMLVVLVGTRKRRTQ